MTGSSSSSVHQNYLDTDDAELQEQQRQQLAQDLHTPDFVTLGQKYSVAIGSTIVLPCKINDSGNAERADDVEASYLRTLFVTLPVCVHVNVLLGRCNSRSTQRVCGRNIDFGHPSRVKADVVEDAC